MPVMRADAAGIDIGATEIFVAVPPDRATEHVRSFPTFTQDLYALADWLKPCGVKTVAMESTGVYWIPLFQILEERGFEVYLVNARHVKNVPGRRTDVSDCQWLQFLHSVGLLRASYRPEQEVCGTFFAPASGKLGGDGGYAREPYAKGIGPDELASASRHQRHHGSDRTRYRSCNLRWGAKSASFGQTAPRTDGRAKKSSPSPW